MKAATLHSEIMTINQDTEFMKSLPDNTMKGYFMIGVYGNKNTTFSLSITSQENGMPHIYPGLSLK